MVNVHYNNINNNMHAIGYCSDDDGYGDGHCIHCQ